MFLVTTCFVVLAVGCDRGQSVESHTYSDCSVENEPVYYGLVEVVVDGEVVGNGMRAPQLLLRQHNRSDLGGLMNLDTEDEHEDTGEDYGLDLWHSNVYYVRQ